jgi:hypothetical protein
MAILKKYKQINKTKTKSQQEFINYLKFGNIRNRKISFQIQLNKVNLLVNKGILKEVKENFNFYVRWDSNLI